MDSETGAKMLHRADAQKELHPCRTLWAQRKKGSPSAESGSNIQDLRVSGENRRARFGSKNDCKREKSHTCLKLIASAHFLALAEFGSVPTTCMICSQKSTKEMHHANLSVNVTSDQK